MSMRYLENVVTLEYDPAKCTGCDKCAEICPHADLLMGRIGRPAMGDRDLCIECGACMLQLPLRRHQGPAGRRLRLRPDDQRPARQARPRLRMKTPSFLRE